MKIHPLVALLCLAAAGAVHAGKEGAGPGASPGPAVGSIVLPGSHALLNTPAKDDNTDRVLPGNAGAIVLEGEQIERAAAALRTFPGVELQNEVIKAPTALADGTPAVIALNTRTGRLLVTRQER